MRILDRTHLSRLKPATENEPTEDKLTQAPATDNRSTKEADQERTREADSEDIGDAGLGDSEEEGLGNLDYASTVGKGKKISQRKST
jgi:hypothetical protein